MDAARIIDNLGGTTVVADLCGVLPSTVSNWRQRESIPAKYWRIIAATAAQQGIAGITLERLAKLHELSYL